MIPGFRWQVIILFGVTHCYGSVWWNNLMDPTCFFVILVTSCTCPSAALYTTEARKRSKVTLQNWLVDTMYIYIYIIFNFLSAEVKTPQLINLWICPEAGPGPPPWTHTPDLCNFFAMDKSRFTAIQCTILVCFNSTQRNCASLHPLRLLWHLQSCNSVIFPASADHLEAWLVTIFCWFWLLWLNGLLYCWYCSVENLKHEDGWSLRSFWKLFALYWSLVSNQKLFMTHQEAEEVPVNSVFQKYTKIT